MRNFLYILVLFFTTAAAASLDLSVQNRNIGKNLVYFEDKSAKMGLEDIRKIPADRFKRLNKEIDSQLFTRSAYWYIFNAHNKEASALERLIVFGIPWLDDVKVYVEDENKNITEYKGGDTLAFSSRAINEIFINFLHPFAPGSSKVYIRVQTLDPFIVPVSVIDTFTFLKDETRHSAFSGFVYGIIVAMILYNFILFLSIQARQYIFYVLYLSLFLIMSTSYNCYTFKWFFFDDPQLQNWAESTTIFLFSIGGLLFAQSFLNLKKTFPQLQRATNCLILFFAATMILTFMAGYHYHIMFAIAFSVLFSLYVFSIALYSLLKGNYYARFFLLGTTAGLFGTSITALSVMSLVPYSDLGFHAIDYGMTIDAILLSFALADKLKIIENEKKHAQDEAKKALEAKNAKGEFLSNMSHEIRTPMNAILGFIHLLKKNIKDEKNLSYVNIILSNSQTLLHIIDDILDLSTIENGKLVINKQFFHPQKELEYVVKLFEPTAKERSIELMYNIDPKVPYCLEGDLVRIKQIMFNFLSNAFKFTSHDKSIFIDITYKDSTLMISVKDEGIGIPLNAQERIFGAFEQAYDTTAGKYGGTGLGLSISLKLAHLMGGDISLFSQEGEGSTFTLSLPLENCESEEVESLKEKESELVEDFDYSELCGNILVAEDNKMNQMLMNILLQEYSLVPTIVDDGAEALKAFISSKFDLILMDESMPNMTGIEAICKMREHESNNSLKPTPIVALTANVMEEDRERFFKAGADDFIAKPIDMAELNRALKRFLS